MPWVGAKPFPPRRVFLAVDRTDDARAVELTRQGMDCARAGDLTGAIRRYDQAIRAADHLPALMNRACAYYHLGQDDEAVRDSTWALEVDEDHPPMWLLRGMARSRSGDLDGARADLTRYLAFEVKTRYRKVAKRALRDLVPTA